MIARADGQVVLVSGALPAEVVRAQIERVGKGVAFAAATAIEEASPDRREPFTDPLCGGCLYAHIAYPRQLTLKAEVIADAFGRIAHLPLGRPVPVAGSPEEGYRMRARLHVQGSRIGFFREGTHQLCDARSTRQLLGATSDVLDSLAARVDSAGARVRELEVSENNQATERAIHPDAAVPIDPASFASFVDIEGVTGLSLGVMGQTGLVSGNSYVTDTLTIDGHELTLRRHVQAFFQGNRFLLAALVQHVAAQADVPQDSLVVDLYAGAGLFALALAAVRQARVTAVEGDRFSAEDLAHNAAASDGRITPLHESVESFTAARRATPAAVVVDPPRTGLSREALEGAIRLGARQLIYVSCDVATLARDARRLVDAGYELGHVAAFDLFPNTPHVETVAVFGRSDVGGV